MRTETEEFCNAFGIPMTVTKKYRDDGSMMSVESSRPIETEEEHEFLATQCGHPIYVEKMTKADFEIQEARKLRNIRIGIVVICILGLLAIIVLFGWATQWHWCVPYAKGGQWDGCEVQKWILW